MTQKFKAWDDKKKCWRNDIALTGQSEFIIRSSPEFNKLVDDWYKSKGDVLGGSYAEIDYTDWAAKDIIICFSTGVKDSNNVECYENDIVETEYGTGKIEFHAGCFMIVWIDDPTANMEILAFDPHQAKYGRPRSDWKIIGNIFQNKDIIAKLAPNG